MTRAAKAVLSELLIAARTVRSIVAARISREFISDDSTVAATVRHLIAMGEIASRADATTKGTHPEIPWEAMTLTGSTYRELGRDVDRQSVWWNAQHHVDRLVPILETALAEASKP